MKRLACLAIIISLINTSNNCVEWSPYYLEELSNLRTKLSEWSKVTARLSDWDENCQRDYKNIVANPLTKIIHEAAKTKEQQVDDKILQINEELSFFNNLTPEEIHKYENKPLAVYECKPSSVQFEIWLKNTKLEHLKQKKELFHEIATDPNAYVEYRDDYFTKVGEIRLTLGLDTEPAIIEEVKFLEKFQKKELNLLEEFKEKHPEILISQDE